MRELVGVLKGGKAWVEGAPVFGCSLQQEMFEDGRWSERQLVDSIEFTEEEILEQDEHNSWCECEDSISECRYLAKLEAEKDLDPEERERLQP
jgi:hypothetical protein